MRAVVNSYHRDLYPPTVSFVIPCYRQSQFLEEAIRSALGQTFPDVEVVVVDDGNDPDEATQIGEIVASFAGGDHRGDHDRVARTTGAFARKQWAGGGAQRGHRGGPRAVDRAAGRR